MGLMQLIDRAWAAAFSSAFGSGSAVPPPPTVTHLTVQAKLDTILAAMVSVKTDVGTLRP